MLHGDQVETWQGRDARLGMRESEEGGGQVVPALPLVPCGPYRNDGASIEMGTDEPSQQIRKRCKFATMAEMKSAG